MSAEAPKSPDASTGASPDSDRIQRRREKVRNNVRALRQRRKDAAKLRQIHEFDSFGLKRHCGNDEKDSNPLLKNGSNHIRLGCELLESKVEWKLNLPYRLSAGASIQDAYITAFRHHCCAPQSSTAVDGDGVYISICCGSWIQSVCMQSSRYDTSLLSRALSASGLATLGAIRQDVGMLSIAQAAQNDVLCGLRQLINQYGENSDKQRLHFTSIALLTCAVTDLLVTKSWTTFSLHLEGVGALIESAGPEALSSLEGFEHYHGYRSVQLTFSFVERKASFMSLPQWTNLPAPSRLTLDDIQTGQLLDIIYQVPELMQKVDMKLAGQSRTIEYRTNDLQQELTCIVEIAESLNSWERICYPWPSDSPLNVSNRSYDKPWKKELDFTNTHACKLWTYSCGARVALHELALTISRNTSRPKDEELENSVQDYTTLTYEWAIRGCQCLNYILRKLNNIYGKLYALFCLDMTWKAMSTLHNDYSFPCAEELRWCEHLAVKLGGTGLPVLRVHSRLDTS